MVMGIESVSRLERMEANQKAQEKELADISMIRDRRTRARNCCSTMVMLMFDDNQNPFNNDSDDNRMDFVTNLTFQQVAPQSTQVFLNTHRIH
jgi:hypothetical protein